MVRSGIILGSLGQDVKWSGPWCTMCHMVSSGIMLGSLGQDGKWSMCGL